MQALATSIRSVHYDTDKERRASRQRDISPSKILWLKSSSGVDTRSHDQLFVNIEHECYRRIAWGVTWRAMASCHIKHTSSSGESYRRSTGAACFRTRNGRRSGALIPLLSQPLSRPHSCWASDIKGRSQLDVWKHTAGKIKSWRRPVRAPMTTTSEARHSRHAGQMPNRSHVPHSF
jgi:hypothetical protein